MTKHLFAFIVVALLGELHRQIALSDHPNSGHSAVLVVMCLVVCIQYLERLHTKVVPPIPTARLMTS